MKANSEGKVFLDYACDDGMNAIYAVQQGAKLSIGIDISNISIINARKEAKHLGLTNIEFIQADAENILLPADSVKTVICSGMLHHLDLSYAFPKLRRILTPGGKILAVEALDYNPIIKLYRMLTPAMRTEWEKTHILSKKDITFAKRFFNIGDIKYWHVIIYAAGIFPPALPILNFLDKLIVKIPLLQLMAWIFTFELIKAKED
jgi:ubiquinone/menaquinone biosynthesis C-methylase UbiE